MILQDVLDARVGYGDVLVGDGVGGVGKLTCVDRYIFAHGYYSFKQYVLHCG